MRQVGGTRSAWIALAAATLFATCGCSSVARPGSESFQREATSDVPATAKTLVPGTPLALLSHGDQYTLERLGDAAYEVIVRTTPEGCVSVTLADGREMLLYAPSGSRVSEGAPRIRLADEYGYTAFDVGDSVELRGWVKDVWKAAGASAPRDWRQCVGERGDHEPMLVIATNNS